MAAWRSHTSPRAGAAPVGDRGRGTFFRFDWSVKSSDSLSDVMSCHV